jgi:hypothetical protein
VAEDRSWRHETDVLTGSENVRFSNRPFGVKHFQTIHHHCSVDVAHGLVLLLSMKTSSDRRTVKMTRFTRNRHGRPSLPIIIFLNVSNIDRCLRTRKSMLVPSPPLVGIYR